MTVLDHTQVSASHDLSALPVVQCRDNLSTQNQKLFFEQVWKSCCKSRVSLSFSNSFLQAVKQATHSHRVLGSPYLIALITVVVASSLTSTVVEAQRATGTGKPLGYKSVDAPNREASVAQAKENQLPPTANA